MEQQGFDDPADQNQAAADGDADMLDAQAAEQHDEQHHHAEDTDQQLSFQQDQQQQQHTGQHEADDYLGAQEQQQEQEEQHDQPQQQLHSADSAGLQQLEQQPSNEAGDAAADAEAGGAARRMSAANSDTAEDNLLSGLADDADDLSGAAKPSGAGAATGSGTPIAQGSAGANAVLPEGVKLGNSKFEQELAAALASGRPLNARQRRTLARAVSRAQGGDGAAGGAGRQAVSALDVNGTGSGGQGDEQQQPKVGPQWDEAGPASFDDCTICMQAAAVNRFVGCSTEHSKWLWDRCCASKHLAC